MLNLSLNELKLIVKHRGIRGYKSMSEDELIEILSEPDPKVNFSKLNKKQEKN